MKMKNGAKLIKQALAYSKLRHIRWNSAQCTDKTPFNNKNFGCSRCDLIELLTRKNDL